MSSSTVICSAGQIFRAADGKKCEGWVSTGSSGYAFGTGLVRSGSTGEACTAWQMFFNDKGHAGLVVDGHCGPKTIAFAKSWQASAGLKADGVLGAMSRAKAGY